MAIIEVLDDLKKVSYRLVLSSSISVDFVDI